MYMYLWVYYITDSFYRKIIVFLSHNIMQIVELPFRIELNVIFQGLLVMPLFSFLGQYGHDTLELDNNRLVRASLVVVIPSEYLL